MIGLSIEITEVILNGHQIIIPIPPLVAIPMVWPPQWELPILAETIIIYNMLKRDNDENTKKYQKKFKIKIREKSKNLKKL